MKKCFILLFVLSLTPSIAQIKFLNDYFFDCNYSSYQINYAISLASPNGNYTNAQELLKTHFFKNNIDKATQIQALLTHNTLGKEKAISIINSANISEEEKDFAKLWLSFYTNNTTEYNALLVAFQKKYTANYNPIKLKLRGVLNYRDANMWNEIKEQKPQSIKTLDSLIGLPNVTNEDKLYFSLMKLDFLKKNNFRSEEKKYSEEELLDKVVELYQKNKSLFELEILKNTLNKSESKKYKNLIKEINDEQAKTSTYTSTEKVLALLLEYNNLDKKIKVSDVESSINKLLSIEKNATEISKIKALLNVFSLPSEPDLGFMMKGILKPIPFSKEFKQSFSSTSLSKQVLVEKIKSVLKEPQFAEIDKNSSKLNEELETIKDLSIEDIHAFYGLIVFSSYYAKSLQSLKYAFGNFQDKPERKDYETVESFIQFLEKNPLYHDDSRYFFNYLDLKNDEGFQKFITQINILKDKFPGSATILRNGLDCIQINNEKVSENNLQYFYTSYFKLAIDYLAISKIIKSKNDYDSELFSGNLRYKLEHGSTYFENFFSVFSQESKKESEQYLDVVLQKNQANKDLNEIKLLITKQKGGKEYLDAYLKNLTETNKNYYEKIDISNINDLDSTYVSNQSKMAIPILKTKKNFSALEKILPLLYFTSQIDEAQNVIVYILNNDSKSKQYTDSFSNTCIQQLYNELLDDEKAIDQLTKIQNEVPDFEMNYLILTMLKLENEKSKKDGLKLIKSYENKKFESSFGNLEKYFVLHQFFEKNYFKEENISLIFKEIIKKYPVLKDDFKQ
ncbi:MAG TPA: hypothetical protein VK164_02760 [Flavobacterium sp.]|uniref:hypothetical protein n=1 Tax=Flavobacterium sp. TaxID=239 RepID=UPI002B4B4EF2|nr:hypothetical protein [Flavobacterium sp.]HLO72832.1 hypothetical protein [Flavobacterium sp.]